MGLRDAVSALFGQHNTPLEIEWLGPTFRSMILGLTPEELYRTQPHLRIVLSFVARNIAHLGVKAYTRTSDTNRERLASSDPLAMLLRSPNPQMTMFELLESLASDLGLYDTAYWWVHESTKTASGWVIQPIPPAWIVKQSGGTFFAPGNFTVQNPDGSHTEVPADDLIVFHGWNPGKPKHGASPVETLKQILSEQVQAWSYREQVWQRGGRVGAYITRPKDSTWSDTARERFARDWKERWTGQDGAKAGGTPILEDGMTLNRLGFSAREDEWAEVSKLALSTIAAVYHVNPVMVGILDNANFSNTKEFRKMLYSETLGPQLARIESRLNAFLVPRVSNDPDAYIEFNIEEKLQGDFEEQAAILSTSTGAPWMTVNEARSLRNLPAIEGGDERIIPLNVISGGLASPRDTAPKDIGELRVVQRHRALKSGAARSIKSADVDPSEYEAAAEQVLKRFFKRQRESVKAALQRKAAGDPDWWDSERWDKELSDDLFKLAVSTATAIGQEQSKALGFTADDYDETRTLAFLRAVADSRAGAVNSTTRDAIAEALDANADVDDVFDEAEGTRTASGASALVAALAGFAVAETAKQLIGDRASKTWVVSSRNPRSSHAAMDGETVGIDDVFSNGMKWPGDSAGGADEVAGCMCTLQIDF